MANYNNDLTRQAFAALDSVAAEAVRVKREFAREDELCKRYKNEVKDVDSKADQLIAEMNLIVEKTDRMLKSEVDIHATQESIAQSVLSVRQQNASLTRELSDARKKTREYGKRFSDTLTKYEAKWQDYLAIYNTFPLVAARNRLANQKKYDDIMLAVALKDVEDTRQQAVMLKKVKARLVEVRLVELGKIRAIVVETERARLETEARICETEQSIRDLRQRKLGLLTLVKGPVVTQPVWPTVTIPKTLAVTASKQPEPMEMPDFQMPSFSSPPRKFRCLRDLRRQSITEKLYSVAPGVPPSCPVPAAAPSHAVITRSQVSHQATGPTAAFVNFGDLPTMGDLPALHDFGTSHDLEMTLRDLEVPCDLPTPHDLPMSHDLDTSRDLDATLRDVPTSRDVDMTPRDVDMTPRDVPTSRDSEVLSYDAMLCQLGASVKPSHPASERGRESPRSRRVARTLVILPQESGGSLSQEYRKSSPSNNKPSTPQITGTPQITSTPEITSTPQISSTPQYDDADIFTQEEVPEGAYSTFVSQETRMSEGESAYYGYGLSQETNQSQEYGAVRLAIPAQGKKSPEVGYTQQPTFKTQELDQGSVAEKSEQGSEAPKQPVPMDPESRRAYLDALRKSPVFHYGPRFPAEEPKTPAVSASADNTESPYFNGSMIGMRGFLRGAANPTSQLLQDTSNAVNVTNQLTETKRHGGQGHNTEQGQANNSQSPADSFQGRGENMLGQGNKSLGQGDNSQGCGGNVQGQGGNSQGLGGNVQGQGDNSQGCGGNVQGQGGNSQGLGGNVQGQGDSSHGCGGNVQGQGGNSQGLGGNVHGQGGNSQGRGGNVQGQGDNSQGRGGNVQGQSDNSQGQGVNTRGHGGNVPGQGDDPQGLGGKVHSLPDTSRGRGLNIQGHCNNPQSRGFYSQGRGGTVQGQGDYFQGQGDNSQRRSASIQGQGINPQGRGGTVQGRVDYVQGQGENPHSRSASIQGRGRNVQGQHDNSQGCVGSIQGQGIIPQAHGGTFQGYSDNPLSQGADSQGCGGIVQGQGDNSQCRSDNIQGQDRNVKAQSATTLMTPRMTSGVTSCVTTPNTEYSYGGNPTEDGASNDSDVFRSPEVAITSPHGAHFFAPQPQAASGAGFSFNFGGPPQQSAAPLFSGGNQSADAFPFSFGSTGSAPDMFQLF